MSKGGHESEPRNGGNGNINKPPQYTAPIPIEGALANLQPLPESRLGLVKSLRERNSLFPENTFAQVQMLNDVRAFTALYPKEDSSAFSLRDQLLYFYEKETAVKSTLSDLSQPLGWNDIAYALEVMGVAGSLDIYKWVNVRMAYDNVFFSTEGFKKMDVAKRDMFRTLAVEYREEAQMANSLGDYAAAAEALEKAQDCFTSYLRQIRQRPLDLEAIISSEARSQQATASIDAILAPVKEADREVAMFLDERLPAIATNISIFAGNIAEGTVELPEPLESLDIGWLRVHLYNLGVYDEEFPQGVKVYNQIKDWYLREYHPDITRELWDKYEQWRNQAWENLP